MSVFIAAACGKPAPTDAAAIEAGTDPVASDRQATASSDRNLAEALLYRWWGIFEAPDDVDVSVFFDDLFTPDVRLDMPNVELTGSDAIRAGFTALPPDSGRSHELGGVSVRPLGRDRFQLDAEFVYQIARPDGSIDAGHSSYRHVMTKQPDGTFRISELTAELGDKLDVPSFEPSYLANRARGTIVQYLGITDLLRSDYARLERVLSADAEVHGMFDPSLETHNERGDGVLKGIDEITAWLSTRREKFDWVAHRVVDIEVAPLGDEALRADAIIEVGAGPRAGDPIDVTLPVSFVLKDDNGRFMIITKIER